MVRRDRQPPPHHEDSGAKGHERGERPSRPNTCGSATPLRDGFAHDVLRPGPDGDRTVRVAFRGPSDRERAWGRKNSARFTDANRSDQRTRRFSAETTRTCGREHAADTYTCEESG